MKRFTDFLRSKGFYIALGTGVLAFAGLLVAYSYNNTKQELKEQTAIDLNQPAQLDDIPDNNMPELESELVGNNQAKNEDLTAPVDSDSAIPDKKEDEDKNTGEDTKTDETAELATETDAEVPVLSDAAEPDNGPEIVAGLEYAGEQSLTWPLAGNVILPYSMDTTVYYSTLKSYKCNPGMLIAGEEGASVFAAYEGVVSSITDTKEYGTVVTVDMGNGYQATYGQVMNVRVQEGETVSKAQVIAEVAPVSSYYTEEGTHLFFKMTKDGTPINPLTLIQ